MSKKEPTTASIKKAFQPLMSLLAANMGSKVSTIYDEAVALVAAKSGGGNSAAFAKDEAGNVIALHCSYHQKWFKPSEVEFGAKASSASGFNTMCRDGLSKWTKQLAQYKKGKEALLPLLTSGEISTGDIEGRVADLEEQRSEIVPIEGVVGYDTLEDLLASM